MSGSLLSRSEALHAEVRAFAERGQPDPTGFERLACSIARFQADHIPGYRRLVEAHRASLDQLGTIPAVPAEAFRLARVSAFPAEHDEVRFVTSGTSGASRGVHPMRTTATYRELSLRGGQRALVERGATRRVVVALAPPPELPPTSSLGFMMQTFMERLDGRALAVHPEGVPFDGASPARWLAPASGIQLAGLRRAALLALERQEGLLLLATSFALVALLDALAGSTLPAPRNTVVMQTGGFKGRSRSVDPAELRRAVARVFRIPEAQVIAEYGMTELSSQLYEGGLPGGELPGKPGLYQEPPWLRVSAVDPVDLRPVPRDTPGLARFVDLGNVDSAVAVVTQDRVRITAEGIELLGRAPRAPDRGCSLALEALIA